MNDDLLKSFINEGIKSNFKFSSQAKSSAKYSPLENDALFHLPFISMAILAMSKDRKYAFTTGSIGNLVGQTFERTFPAFKSSTQLLAWSANLRARTAKAVVFLETSGLIKINDDKTIQSTDLGKSIINQVYKEDSSLGLAIRGIGRNYRDFMEESQLGLI